MLAPLNLRIISSQMSRASKLQRRQSERHRCASTMEAYRAKPTPRLFPMLSRRILLDKMV